MADARDSKSREGNFMWVRPPPPAPMKKLRDFESRGTSTPVGARPRTSRSQALARNDHTGSFP